jgi:hypothetical protein
MTTKKTGLETLSVEEVTALVAYKQSVGQRWKTQLRSDWMRAGTCHVDNNTYSLLQQLRNRLGPSWLRGVQSSALDKD